jgi:hypothetical protein
LIEKLAVARLIQLNIDVREFFVHLVKVGHWQVQELTAIFCSASEIANEIILLFRIFNDELIDRVPSAEEVDMPEL